MIIPQDEMPRFTLQDRQDMSLSAKIADDWVANINAFYFGKFSYTHRDLRDELQKAHEMLVSVRNKRWGRWQLLRDKGCACHSLPGDNERCFYHYPSDLEKDDDHRAGLWGVQ